MDSIHNKQLTGRLNLLTPRYLNQKGQLLGGATPGGKARVRAAGQRQLLIPELCAIHPFPVSLWKLAVTLPTTLYRLNHLLLCEQIRTAIALEAAIGAPELPSGAFVNLSMSFFFWF